MSNGFYNVPKAVNEPVKGYAPGSPERTELLAEYKRMYNTTVDVPMYIKKAKALNRMERYREALDSANLAIAIDSKNEEGYSVKVEPLFHLGREEELTAVLEEIIAINPHSPLKAFLNCLRKDRDKAQY